MPALRTTHTYATLAVKRETFDDVRDRIIKGYQSRATPEELKAVVDGENQGTEAEHYFERSSRIYGDGKTIEKICLGEVALVLEGSPQDD